MTRLAMTLTAGLLAAAACGGNDSEGAPPAEAQNRIQIAVPALVDAMDGAMQTLEGGAMEDLAGVLNQLTGIVEGGDEVVTDPQFLFGDGEEELDGEELAQWLGDNIFTDANHEGGGVYLIGGDDVCDPADLECIDSFDQVELRVLAQSAGDGLDMTIMIGASKSSVLFIELRSDSLDVTADLGAIKVGLEEVADGLGEEIDLPETMTGQLRGGLVVDGDEVTISGGVPAAIAIAGTFGGDEVSFSMAENDPIFVLTANLVAQTAQIDVDIPRIDVLAPWHLFDDESVGSHTAALTIGGLSGSLALTAMSESLAIDNLGLGDVTSRMQIDGADVITVDVNADSGRRLDIDLTAGESGVIVGIDPELDVEVGMHLSALPDSTDVPAELLDTVYAVRAQGSAPSLEFIDDGLDELIKVVSGSLTIEAVGEASVTAVAGECLYSNQEPGSGDHPVIGTLAAGSCPL